MEFSNTTTKGGIIQRIEQYTGLGDAGISGDATLLKVVTAQINEAFDEIMPLVLSSTGDQIAWDDSNQTDLPIGTLNAVSGQADYTIATDANSLDILDIKAVEILSSATDTIYHNVAMIDSSSENALDAMSPQVGISGVPFDVLKRGNTLFFYPKFSYSATAGIKLFFERIQSYFDSTDTTKAPGIPRIFHPILPKIAAYHWLAINKPANTVVLQDLAQGIREDKKYLENYSKMRNPTRTIMTMSKINYI